MIPEGLEGDPRGRAAPADATEGGGSWPGSCLFLEPQTLAKNDRRAEAGQGGVVVKGVRLGSGRCGYERHSCFGNSEGGLGAVTGMLCLDGHAEGLQCGVKRWRGG